MPVLFRAATSRGPGLPFVEREMGETRPRSYGPLSSFDAFKRTLIGQDKVYGVAGQVPDYENSVII